MSTTTQDREGRTTGRVVCEPGVTLCLDLGGTAVKAAVARGTAIDSVLTEQIGDDGAVATIRRVAAALGVPRNVLGGHAPDGRVSDQSPASTRIDRVAIAVPGIVDRQYTSLTAAYGKYGDLLDLDLDDWCREEFGVPGTVENDARAALLGEATGGVAAGATDAVLMTLGTGIGTAAMIGGSLVRGSHDHGGVLGGHVTVDLDGPPCNCGNTGCAEAVASTWALPRILRDHPGFIGSTWPGQLAEGPVGFRELVTAADDGDRIATDVLERCTRVWGAVLVGLCHAYDPDVVVVTGGVLGAGDRLLDPVRRYLEAHLWRSMPRPRVVTPTHPDRSVVLGLACDAGSLREASAAPGSTTTQTDADHLREDER